MTCLNMLAHDEHGPEDARCPGRPEDAPPGRVLAALEVDIAALAEGRNLKPNMTSVVEGMRTLARTIDNGSATPAEKTVALRELRASLEEIRQPTGGAATESFRKKVKRAGR